MMKGGENMGADLYFKDRQRSFRDSYNSSNVLWQFDLSWWVDIIPLLDEARTLSPNNAEGLLGKLEARESIFEANLKGEAKEAQEYFRRKYKNLKAFLRKSVDRNEPIVCSL